MKQRWLWIDVHLKVEVDASSFHTQRTSDIWVCLKIGYPTIPWLIIIYPLKTCSFGGDSSETSHVFLAPSEAALRFIECEDRGISGHWGHAWGRCNLKWGRIMEDPSSPDPPRSLLSRNPLMEANNLGFCSLNFLFLFLLFQWFFPQHTPFNIWKTKWSQSSIILINSGWLMGALPKRQIKWCPFSTDPGLCESWVNVTASLNYIEKLYTWNLWGDIHSLW